MFSEVPDALKQKAQEVPLLNNLILPITNLCEARQQIEGQSGPLYAVYTQVQKIFE